MSRLSYRTSGFLGIPGNPAAVLVCLAVLAAAVKGDAHRERLVRATLRYSDAGSVLLEALPRQDSHMLSNLASADALLWLPVRGGAFEAGEVVRWVPV